MNTRGFTLVEIVVALVISGFLAGVVFQLVGGQQRFVGIQSAREEVQQNGRAALELISAELRGASVGGIVAADSTSVRFRVPRAWGLVCGTGGTGGNLVVVFPGSGLAPFKTQSPAADSLAVRDSTSTAAQRWYFSPVTDATPAGGGTAAQCGALGPDAAVQVRTLSQVPGTFPVQVGEPAYLYDVIRYDAADSNVNGKWLRRAEGGAAAQPLAGPLAVDNEIPVFRLRYFDATGGAIAPPLDAAKLAQVAQVEVKVKTVSRSSKVQQEFSDSTRVHLRN